MRNIAIVEDEDQAAAVLTGYIEKYAEKYNQEFNIVRFHNGLDFLKDYQSTYSVVFMDIQMPNCNGMNVAFNLREIDKTVSIIFVTNLSQYAQKGYEVDAVSYLIKPVSYYDFELKFRKGLDIYAMNEEQKVTITVAGGFCRISTDKLMYVEVVKHRLYYHLVDDVIEVTGVLSKVEEELKQYGFMRCNQCFLVNPKFVVSVKGYDVLVGNETLTISRPRKNAFMEELTTWLAGSEGRR
jgi:DNA-binding LytR/AlgR family response regulator